MGVGSYIRDPAVGAGVYGTGEARSKLGRGGRSAVVEPRHPSERVSSQSRCGKHVREYLSFFDVSVDARMLVGVANLT